MAELRDDSREEERKFDIAFGYDDEDPIDRHVRLFLTPNKGKRGGGKKERSGDAPTETSSMNGQDMLHVGVKVDAMADSVQPEDDDHSMVNVPLPVSPPRPFRPGLLHSQRSSRASVSSLTNSAPSITRTESSSSTPLGFDIDLRVPGGVDTPGSTWSEASFEVIKADDWWSLYGPGGETKRQQAWRSTEPRDYFGGMTHQITSSSSPSADRTSMTSMYPTSTITPSSSPAGPSKPPSLTRPRPRAYPYPPPTGTNRSIESSGQRDGANLRSFTPEPRPRQHSDDVSTSALARSSSRYRQKFDDLPVSSVSGMITRSRQSYDDIPLAKFTNLSCRSRQNSDDVKIAKLSTLGHGPQPMSEDDEEWLSGRTISETMVVKAGFRSQRGRHSVRVGR